MNFTIILSFILIWFIQIEAVAYESKMANEVKECENTLTYMCGAKLMHLQKSIINWKGKRDDTMPISTFSSICSVRCRTYV